MFTQEAILNLLLPELKTEGRIFQKNRKVLARQAQAGEWIHTHTSDGLETANAAEAGDFIVRNQTAAGEEYIVPAHKFKEKYSWLSAVDELWHEYLPLGRIIAVELTPERLQRLGLPEQFEFQAPWEDPMTAKSGDFMGGPEDFSEVYRLARKEFFETYAPLAGA